MELVSATTSGKAIPLRRIEKIAPPRVRSVPKRIQRRRSQTTVEFSDEDIDRIVQEVDLPADQVERQVLEEGLNKAAGRFAATSRFVERRPSETDQRNKLKVLAASARKTLRLLESGALSGSLVEAASLQAWRALTEPKPNPIDAHLLGFDPRDSIILIDPSSFFGPSLLSSEYRSGERMDLVTDSLKALIAWADLALERATDLSSPPGHPEDYVRRVLVSDLLWIYFIAFDRLPSRTSGGPTIRFLSACLEQFNIRLSADALLDRVKKWRQENSGAQPDT